MSFVTYEQIERIVKLAGYGVVGERIRVNCEEDSECGIYEEGDDDLYRIGEIILRDNQSQLAPESQIYNLSFTL